MVNMKRYKTILATFLLAIPICVTAQEEVFPTFRAAASRLSPTVTHR